MSQEKQAKKATRQGDLITKARIITLSLVFAAVIISLAFDTGLGTPSAFGIGQFFLLCPLGGIEALLASKAFVPVTLISLAVVAAFALLFGRAWCAWGCPAPTIRKFFKRNLTTTVDTVSATSISANEQPPCTLPNKQQACSPAGEAKRFVASLRYLGRDKRTWILGVVLVATLIAGIPLFCLVCPIGLTFGTVGSLWHLIVDKQITLSVVVFPAALLIELVVYRKWCMNLCPIAGLLNIFGQFALLFRPRVDTSTCMRASKGKPCNVCTAVCTEHIDLHAKDTALQLGECTRCGECVKHCPTGSVRITIKSTKSASPLSNISTKKDKQESRSS
ncbi:MAG: 4Fe-4S binding protein [Gordonibacter sp.]|nr:4Fe-4S binding protein [Gordonibacter sp.]